MRKASTVFSIGFVVLCSVAWTASTPESPERTTSMISVAFDADRDANAAFACNVDCYQPWTCEGCQHKAPYVGEGTGSHEEGAGDHDYCWDGYCDMGSGGGCEAKHDLCNPEDLLNTVLQDLTGANFVDLAYALESGAGAVIDWEDSTILLNDCAGRVQASIDLTPAEVGALALAAD